MIAVDTSALVSIALAEPDRPIFVAAIASDQPVIGTPTLVELHLVLSRRMTMAADFIARLLQTGSWNVVPFDMNMYEVAAAAFNRYGQGHHPAALNFGDCLSYAVAKTQNLPLLYKGGDFALTDIRPALA